MTEYQHYFACAHHLSAIDNFFEKRTTCEWGCHETELKWYHSGVHPMPQSWGGIPRSLAAQHKFGE